MKSLTEQFSEGIKEIESVLFSMGFHEHSFQEETAYYIEYKKNKTIVKFLFGPGDWDVEMIIFTTKGKFAFKDLLQIPAIEQWVANNRYQQVNGREIGRELVYAINLLKISLPIVE